MVELRLLWAFLQLCGIFEIEMIGGEKSGIVSVARGYCW